jgi:hypothetical protein
MHKAPLAVNPFSLMIEPEAVLQAVERSERLNRLRRHVCRPLDRPVIPKLAEAEDDEQDEACDIDLELDAESADAPETDDAA